jgi:CXXC-20-CXXC protein
MKKCDVCTKKFSWKQKFISMFSSSSKIVCPNCKTEYKIILLSRIIISVLSILIPGLIATSIYQKYSLKSPLGVLVYLILSFIAFIIAPIFIKYKKG